MKISFTSGLIKTQGYNREPIYLNPDNITMIKGNSGNKNKSWVDTVNNTDGPYIEVNASASDVAAAFLRAKITGSTAVVKKEDNNKR